MGSPSKLNTKVKSALVQKYGDSANDIVSQLEALEDQPRNSALVRVLAARERDVALKIISDVVGAQQAVSETVSELQTADDVNLSNTRLAKHGGKGQFQCRSCKSWDTQFTEKQMRSGDEPSTLFVRCMAPGCRKRWTVNG
ncbi:MAG: hypothetical protein CMC99_03070 [Flavobacteriales bacterium]|nr:hypothetical protein [Flavobacteriales bacterium]|tara:strand:- start:732 stop:1154 length:423 start_codon:yes stop_codon:yes gene_type:complete